MGVKGFGVAALVLLLIGCAQVRQKDLDSWVGQPVSALDIHPVFLTMKVVRTVSADGTEVRNYVNGKQVMDCSGGGSVFAGTISSAAYNQFMSCTNSRPTCNNIFYIKDGRVTNYTPIGTGGGRCFTDERARPGFRGATNL